MVECEECGCEIDIVIDPSPDNVKVYHYYCWLAMIERLAFQEQEEKENAEVQEEDNKPDEL